MQFAVPNEVKCTLNLQELIDELGIYLLQYDRAGYGESDPNPKRSLKSEVLDIEELADQLKLGSKFYVVGVSMGSYATWSCLKYIPHRQITCPKLNYAFILFLLFSFFFLLGFKKLNPSFTTRPFVQASRGGSGGSCRQLSVAFTS